MTSLPRQLGLAVFYLSVVHFGTGGSSVCAQRYSVVADTRIDSAAPSNNYGSDTIIRLIRNSESDRDGSVIRGLLRFDLPDLPQEAVADARLWMTLTRVRGPEDYDPYSRDVVIRPLTAGFAELGATWLERDYEEELLWTSPGGDFSVEPVVQVAWNPPEDIMVGDGSWLCSWDLLPLWNNTAVRDNGVILMLDPETPPDSGFLNYAFATRESSGFDDEVIYVEVTLRSLQAGDADQDFDFDQLDLVAVQVAAKYLTGQPATWGEGDWDGAPAGSYGAPPTGNGVFDQLDIVAALNAGKYLTGPYTAIGTLGAYGDGQTSIAYSSTTGAISVDAPSGQELASVHIESASSIFTGTPAQNLGGSFDDDKDNNIFRTTFGSSFGSLSFGNVARTGLSQDFVSNNLTVVGSLAGGGDLRNVDLISISEPASLWLLGIELVAWTAATRRVSPCADP